MTGQPTLRTRTKRGLIWASAEAGARTLLQTLVLVVLSRLLSPDDYGVVGAAMIIVGLSTIFSQLGVGPAVVQRATIEPRHLDAAFVVSVVFGTAMALLVYGCAPLFAAFFKMDALGPALRLMCLIFPISGLAVVWESLMQRELRFDLIARAEIMALLASGSASIILAICDWGLWALVWGQIVLSFARALFLGLYHPWRPRLACARTALRDLRQFSTGTTIARLANYLATNGDNLVVGRFLGAAALGVYGRAYQLMSTPANLIGNVLEKVLFPAMARVQKNELQLAAVYRQGIGLLASVMLPISAVIYLLAPELVPIALGDKWVGAIFPLQIFSLALLFRTSMKLSNSLIRAKGAVFQLALCQGAYAVGTIGSAFAGLRWGIQGVCVGVFASIVLCFTLAAWITLRLVHLSWWKFGTDHLPGIGLAALTFLAGWIPCSLLRAQNASPGLVLLLAGGSMACLGVALLGIFPKTFLGPEGARLRGGARTIIAKARRTS